MKTVYLWNESDFYFTSREVDENGELPNRCTFTVPPELEGEQVARWTGSRWEVLAEAPAAPDIELDVRRADLTADNNAQYDTAISLMTCDYPAAEITTWERQRAEAVAWGADSTAPTPWIDIAATARGLDRDEYLARTLAKVNAFAMASAYLTGRRQGIDDQIRAATTAEELAAVVIDYTLPGA
ncbi:hypothetical protein PS918_03144 [Pseudomonas fluorescens]|uniref:DUF4376 domain-containing protein n=1 Tax=Pseudomonas fluorescens TaxID=294 RepID=A0A5E7T2Y3_PSEFL|nr:hypothetical protein [Pseudomonas fluorescens]VVP90043.1 hypothetical protein PS918_03144 [Pseudomonas fluorescens]